MLTYSKSPLALALLAFFSNTACDLRAENAKATGEWPCFGGNLGCLRYSPLDAIAQDNFDTLELAWRWDVPDEELRKKSPAIRSGFFKCTPLMVDGMLYVGTPISQVAAINPATGKTIWLYDPHAYDRPGSRRMFQHRGVSYWTDGDDARVIITTGTRQLIALNAKTGEPYSDFGDGGWTDLGKGLGRNIEETQLYFSAPPVIVRDTIVIGSSLPDEASNPTVPPGHVRGFDVRSGKQKWIFHTIPEEGELGNDTWQDGSWKNMGASNVWTMMSGDEDLGYAYFGTGTPTNDFYGGHRLGDNVFAESIVCVNAETGERIWHFQGVHHGLWDYDFPAAPILVDITVDGKPIKALAQVSKQGFIYVFDRATGEPVWPIEEKPVPPSDVPGERAAPTQPFPTKPPPFERQGISEDDLIDFTPELRQEAIDFVKKYKLGPLFTPPTVAKADLTGGLIQLPGAAGGANWGSAGVDPENGILYVQSATIPSLAGLVKPDPARSSFKYIRGGPWGLPPRPSGLPLTKPPYGRITAIDLNRGEILWQVPHGDGPRDHPLLKGLNLPRLGAPSNTVLSHGGPLVTKTLVVYSHVEVDPSGDWSDSKWWLICYDKKTGDEAARRKLPLPPFAVPMTYMHEGRQYLVIAVGGSRHPAALLAYALP
jgi:quinoprotein glucose dehydrogenase